MQVTRWRLGFAALATIGLLAASPTPGLRAQGPQRVFELRTYTAAPGKLEALKARFRDHTLAIFERHGMTNIGYWVPADTPGSENTLVYLLAHDSREAAARSWDAFREDPDWKAARAASERDGSLVTKVDSLYLDPTDFSALR
jgi:hypothetical protein